MPLRIVRDDLSNMRADAVVLPSNERLIISGGAGEQVARKAGLFRLRRACRKKGGCPVGSAVSTPAFSFPAKYLIHAVGPVWNGRPEDYELLVKAYRSALELAAQLECGSIAVPLLSAGSFGCPAHISLSLGLSAIEEFLAANDMDVTLVLFDRKAVAAGLDFIGEIESLIDDRYVADTAYQFRDVSTAALEEPDWLSPEDLPARNAPIASPSETMSVHSETPFAPAPAAPSAPAPAAPAPLETPSAPAPAAPAPLETPSAPAPTTPAPEETLSPAETPIPSATPSAPAPFPEATTTPAAPAPSAAPPSAETPAPTATPKSPAAVVLPSATFPEAGQRATQSPPEIPCGAPMGQAAEIQHAAKKRQGLRSRLNKQAKKRRFAEDAAEAIDGAAETSQVEKTFAGDVAAARKAADDAQDAAGIPGEAAGEFLPTASFAPQARAVSAEPVAAISLEERLGGMQRGFSETLLELIDKSNKTDAQVYRRANMTRQHFSKIRNNVGYRPTKPTVLALCVALELDLSQTQDLLERAGFAFSPASKFDIIVEYFIEKGVFDPFKINETLFYFDQPLLGG